MTHETLKQALGTNLEPVVIKTREFEFNGNTRQSLTVKKANGKKLYLVVKYENGRYSETA